MHRDKFTLPYLHSFNNITMLNASLITTARRVIWLRIWTVDEKTPILNKRLRMADKEWPPAFRLVGRLTIPHREYARTHKQTLAEGYVKFMTQLHTKSESMTTINLEISSQMKNSPASVG
jgi:hypothetical protein